MSKVTITESILTAIGNAIRAKLGGSTYYKPSQMAAAIESIPTGITPTGTVSITANGTTDVTNYASAEVNVQPTLQSKTVTANGTVTPDSGYDGLSSVVVNVPTGGGGTSGVLAGTAAPSASAGSEGDVYLQYTVIGSGAISHTYVLQITAALRGSNSLTYAGATEIDLIFDDGAGGEVSIRSLSDFSYSATNGNGGSTSASSAFDGSTSSYWEANPTPITLNMTATIPAGYTPKTLKVMQRTGSYTSDVWKTFTLTDTVGTTEAAIAGRSDMTVSDWAGAGNYTEFSCNGGVSGNFIEHCYVKGSSGWEEVGNQGALDAILAQVIG